MSWIWRHPDSHASYIYFVWFIYFEIPRTQRDRSIISFVAPIQCMYIWVCPGFLFRKNLAHGSELRADSNMSCWVFYSRKRLVIGCSISKRRTQDTRHLRWYIKPSMCKLTVTPLRRHIWRHTTTSFWQIKYVCSRSTTQRNNEYLLTSAHRVWNRWA